MTTPERGRRRPDIWTFAPLYAAIPHGTGQTLLREALLVADHNAYHLGALVTLRRALEAARDA